MKANEYLTYFENWHHRFTNVSLLMLDYSSKLSFTKLVTLLYSLWMLDLVSKFLNFEDRVKNLNYLKLKMYVEFNSFSMNSNLNVFMERTSKIFFERVNSFVLDLDGLSRLALTVPNRSLCLTHKARDKIGL